MKIVRFLILSSFVFIIPGLSLAGSPSVSSFEIQEVSDGPDFCEKLSSFIKDLNQEASLNITQTDCSITEDGWLSDNVKVLLLYRHKNCLGEELYFRPIQFPYEGIEYSWALKTVLTNLGLKFISQAGDDSRTTKANGNENMISIGIPRCMEN